MLGITKIDSVGMTLLHLHELSSYLFQEAMRKMTEEDKRKILQQVELFRREKMTFDNEVAKWDDAGNDIIMLAKHMCMIMLEMTDFTRYRPSILPWRTPNSI